MPLITPNRPPRRIDGDPPIDADDVPSSRREGLEEPRGPGTEMDGRDPRLADFIEQAARERGNTRVVVPRTQRASPTVEHLEGFSARPDPRPKIRRSPADWPIALWAPL